MRPNHLKTKIVLFDYLETLKTKDNENYNDFLRSTSRIVPTSIVIISNVLKILGRFLVDVILRLYTNDSTYYFEIK